MGTSTSFTPQSTVGTTDMHRLTVGIRTERGVVVRTR